jgi:hypothetical protein
MANCRIRFHVQPRLWGETRFVTRRDGLELEGTSPRLFMRST